VSGESTTYTGRPVSERRRIVHLVEKRAAACEHDPALDHVGGELWRRALERLLDCVDDAGNRAFEGAVHLVGLESESFEQAGQLVAPGDLRLAGFGPKPARQGRRSASRFRKGPW
jgi:hypothetical protein